MYGDVAKGGSSEWAATWSETQLLFFLLKIILTKHPPYYLMKPNVSGFLIGDGSSGRKTWWLTFANCTGKGWPL